MLSEPQKFKKFAPMLETTVKLERLTVVNMGLSNKKSLPIETRAQGALQVILRSDLQRDTNPSATL